jgi:hypothetical protein
MHRPIFANPSFFIFAVVAAGCANAYAQPCAPVITQNPHPVGTCSNTATFSVIATSDTPVGYRWQIQTGPTLWQTMTTNPLPLPCLGGMAAADPPFESTTTIMMDPCPGVQVYQIRVEVLNACGDTYSTPVALTFPSADFNGDGDIGTDADIEAFFACLGGNCCTTCGTADFNGDGDVGTDADIEAFFRVLAGGGC